MLSFGRSRIRAPLRSWLYSLQPTPGPRGVIASNMSFRFTRPTKPLQGPLSRDVSIGTDVASRRLPHMPYLNANSPNIQIARDGLLHFHLDKPSNSMHGWQIRPMLSSTILYLAITQPHPTSPPTPTQRYRPDQSPHEDNYRHGPSLS